MYRKIAVAEKHHEERYNAFIKDLEESGMFAKDREVTWRCLNCGYIHTGKEAPEKCENTSFIVKSFIQQLFSDLSSSSTFSQDIPDKIKKVMRNFISDKSLLPIGFLTTFEFNRLEFDTKGRLINMTGERKALLTCMIILYRVLLIDIFKKHFTYFPGLREMKPDEKKIEEAILRRVDERKRKNIMKKKEEELKMKKMEKNKFSRSKKDPFSKYHILNHLLLILLLLHMKVVHMIQKMKVVNIKKKEIKKKKIINNFGEKI